MEDVAERYSADFPAEIGPMQSAETALEFCDEAISSGATREDLKAVLGRKPRTEDWFLTLTRSNDDFMDATLGDEGTFAVQCRENGKAYRATSVVDEALLESLLVSFLERDDSWSRQCKWDLRPVGKPASATVGLPMVAWAGIGLALLVLALEFSGQGKWIAVLFALVFPGVIAFAIVAKMGEVRRASTWTQASAVITRSELVAQERKRPNQPAQIVKIPAVEYEFSVRFDKFRGNRISIGEIAPGSPQVAEIMRRYPAGASVAVYYDPADPTRSVLERGLPKHFALIWVFVALLAVVCVGGALWYTGVIR